MAGYTVTVKTSARKEWDALNDKLFDRIKVHILALADDPRPAGCTKLKNEINLWRIRVGDYRIVYMIDDLQKAIRVMRIAPRRTVYE